ncbi:hypothetical protein RF55_15317 [Lasius niger]|uniref:Uncharacterized protein n=1 Tax=Lasius niger TaxID=67767 RepID=A0A0J7K5V2_LASNI|nr:hypothetical protein RF55_15317 [Lasius niger]
MWAPHYSLPSLDILEGPHGRLGWGRRSPAPPYLPWRPAVLRRGLNPGKRTPLPMNDRFGREAVAIIHRHSTPPDPDLGVRPSGPGGWITFTPFFTGKHFGDPCLRRWTRARNAFERLQRPSRRTRARKHPGGPTDLYYSPPDPDLRICLSGPGVRIASTPPLREVFWRFVPPPPDPRSKYVRVAPAAKSADPSPETSRWLLRPSPPESASPSGMRNYRHGLADPFVGCRFPKCQANPFQRWTSTRRPRS